MDNKNLIKGFHICNIRKNKINDSEFVEDIKTKDSKITQEVMDVIENKGKVYGVKKDQKLKAIFLFERVENEKKKTLKLSKKIFVDEINKEMEQQIENKLLERMAQDVALEEVSKVIFEDKEIVPEEVKIGKTSIALSSFIFILSIIIGMVFFYDHWYICMGAGIAIGAICGAVIKKR